MLTKSSLVYSVLWYNRTMVRMLTSSGEGHGFDPQFGQTKYYIVGFSSKHAELKS
jgi:hypothetical protein